MKALFRLYCTLNSTLNSTLKTLSLLAVLCISGCDLSPSTEGIIVTNQESDPVIADFPIAYIERPLPTDEDGEMVAFNILDQSAFHPGARLILKERASASAKETVVTAGVFEGLETDPETGEELSSYDVKDLEVSADGRKLIFAMRAPEIEDVDDDAQPTWNIWEYDLDATSPQPRRIIPFTQSIQAENGQDVEPHYLPNGLIVFSSTRQSRTQAILIDEGKPQYSALDDKNDIEAMVLHTMEIDGSDIKQISFNASHDLQPSVLQSGEIVFLRWDAINNKDNLSLYKANPDGSNIQLYYGFHTQSTGTNDTDGVFEQPRELPDGRIMVNLQPRDSLRFGGDIVAIDSQNFIANNQAIDANRGATGPAQESLISSVLDSSGDTPSTGGYFSSSYPLDDGTDRLLVSWSQCRMIDPNTELYAPCSDALIEAEAEQAPPLYGLWIYNTTDGTQLPIKLPKARTMYTDAVSLAPKRAVPEDIRNNDVDPELVAENVGVLHIRNVYDIDAEDTTPSGIDILSNPTLTAAQDRPARFIRIVKNVPLPDDDVRDFDNSAFGPNNRQRMRDIIGYVPIEPDGSAKFKVPSDIPFMIEILDEQGRRSSTRHENWLHLKAGEERECTGCHTRNSELPHGRLDAEAVSVYDGATGAAPFPGTQLRDANGTPEVDPEISETMAEYYARLMGPRTPSMDIIYVDDWIDPAGTFPAADPFQWRFVDVLSNVNINPNDSNCQPLSIEPAEWIEPTNCTAAGSWTSLCRTTINYQGSIHPLWEADRRSCDDTGLIVEDHTCTSCHSSEGNTVLSAAQLELTGEISIENNDYITSYSELVVGSASKIIKTYRTVEGALETALETEFERVFTGAVEEDENGDPILDENGFTIPILQVDALGTVEIDPSTGQPFLQYTNGDEVRVGRTMNQNGALSSNAFFDIFEPGALHAGYLSEHELKLISEWIDIGGQYYNDPFDAPAN